MNTTFTIFGLFPIYTFSLILAIGVGLGLFWTIWPVSILTKTVRERINCSAVGLIGAVFGGRLGYSLENWSYFKNHMNEIFQVWLGGFSWLGALVGALFAIFIMTIIIGISFGKITDGLLPLLTCSGISIWIACWITGYAYGLETEKWFGVPAIDEWGVIVNRLPTQLLGVIMFLVLHRLVEIFNIKVSNKVQGAATSIHLAGLALILLIISPFRGDLIPFWREIRIDNLNSAAVLMISIVLYAYNFGIFNYRKVQSENKRNNEI